MDILIRISKLFFGSVFPHGHRTQFKDQNFFNVDRYFFFEKSDVKNDFFTKNLFLIEFSNRFVDGVLPHGQINQFMAQNYFITDPIFFQKKVSIKMIFPLKMTFL